MERAVTCIVQNQEQAEWIVGALRRTGFTTDTISVLFPTERRASAGLSDADVTPRQGMRPGVAAGGAFGGELGLLEGLGALTIPGLGQIVAGGPLAPALRTPPEGDVNGIAGALMEIGVPKDDASRYEAELKAGSIFVSVDTDTREQRKRVEEIFEAAYADDILWTSGALIPQVLHRRTLI